MYKVHLTMECNRIQGIIKRKEIHEDRLGRTLNIVGAKQDKTRQTESQADAFKVGYAVRGKIIIMVNIQTPFNETETRRIYVLGDARHASSITHIR